MPLISSKASDGHTCRLVRTRQRVLPWLHLHLYSTKEGNRPRMKKKKAAFPFKGRPKGCETIRVWPQGSSFETKRKAVSVQLSQTDKP